MVFAFGEYRLDLRRRELRRDCVPIELEPQTFDLLACLIGQRDRVVSKHELIELVWGGRIVSDSAVTSRLSAVRRAIGDTGATQLLIRTFPRKGVRFIGEVAEVPDRAAMEAINAPPVPLSPAPDRPSIAVLPFVNLTGDRDQEAFSEGTAEEITTALSRIRWLFVAARQSSFIYKNQAINATTIGRELGVRYLLEGSVRKAGNRIRVTAQLVEAETGAHLWADHFDGSIEDPFELQDRVATSIAGVIEPTVQETEAVRRADLPASQLTPFEAYLRAWAMHVASGKHVPRALALLEEAIARDPNYGPALANAAVCCLRLCLDGLSKDPQADRHSGVDYARRALRVARDDPATLAHSALALGFFGEDIGAAEAIVDRALALNPSFARGWYQSSIIRFMAGEPDLAIEHAERSLRLSPRGRVGSAFNIIGAAHLVRERFDMALPKLQLAVQEEPDYPSAYRFLAACYAHLGRFDEGRDVVTRLRAITTLIVHDLTYLRNPEQRALVLSGLRRVVGERE